MRYIFIIFILILSSCAPLKKQITCEERFYKLLKNSRKEVKPFRISGTIFAGGVFFLFTGNFDRGKSISIFTPLGQKVVSIRYKTDKELCLLYKDQEDCGFDSNILSKYIKTDIPFNLENLLTGRFHLDEKSSYECENNFITVKTGNYTIRYRGFFPEEVKFKNFTAYYRYESGKIRSIFILKNNEELLKIYVKSVRWL